jgi:hypothetical protein
MDNQAITPTSDTIDHIDTPIPIGKILEYKQKGLSLQAIADINGRSKQSVSQRLKPYRHLIEGLDAYKARKSDILHLKGQELLEALTPGVIKEMKGRDLVVSYGIMYDKAQLEDGKPTALVAYADLCQNSDAIDKRLEELGVMDIEVVEAQGAEQGEVIADASDTGAITGVQVEEGRAAESFDHPPSPVPQGGDEG